MIMLRVENFRDRVKGRLKGSRERDRRMTGCAAGRACGNWAPQWPIPKDPLLMRICIFGAGAVGSHFAVRLALAGHNVSCVMRGPHLEAVRAKGLTLRVGETEFSARMRASDDPAALGPQDLVISTLKATALAR